MTQTHKELVKIETKDGMCRTAVFRPPHDKTHGKPAPAVIVYLDGIGFRDAMDPIGARLAEHGYFVIMPDIFYRAGEYVAPKAADLFTNPEVQKAWWPKGPMTATPENVTSDTAAFIAWLDRQPDVKHDAKIGTTGYCMGGGLALRAAAMFPDRIGAAASFHGGRLATDDEASPHLLAPKMKAKIYVAGAVEDTHFDDAEKKRLDDALTAAKVDHEVLTYEGCKHGWVPQDTPVHDAAGEERHFQALFKLYDAALR